MGLHIALKNMISALYQVSSNNTGTMEIANRIVNMVEGSLYRINLGIKGIHYSKFHHGVQKHPLTLCKELVTVHFVWVQNSILR